MRGIAYQEKDEHGERDAEKRVEADEFKQEEGDEGADDDHGAVGDIDHIHDSPGQGEAHGDVGIDRAEEDPIQKNLECQDHPPKGKSERF